MARRQKADVPPATIPGTALAAPPESPAPEVPLIAEQSQPHVIAELAAASFHGPIPPPSLLQGYEALVPGSAARFLESFHELQRLQQDQARHRMELERIVVH